MRKWALVFVLMCLVPTASAQEGRRGGVPSTFFVRARVESETVKGAPYSADVINQSVQTLSDGNRIVRSTTSHVYRDSEGRVRREEERPSGSPGVTITDPVAGNSWVLDVENRSARQSPMLARIYSSVVGPSGDVERLTLFLNGQPSVFVAPNWTGRGSGPGGEQT